MPSFFLLILGACLLFGASIGIRMNYGILLNAYASQGNVPYDQISLVIAVGELIYGISQPIFGILAMKKSNAFILKIGLCLLAAGFLSSSVMRSGIALVFTFGICLSAGTGAVCFGMIMGAISKFVPKSKAAMASGIVNASNGVMSSALSPVMQSLLATLGITKAMCILSTPYFILMPVAFWFAHIHFQISKGEIQNKIENQESVLKIIKNAFADNDFKFLCLGFATCGFHMSLIQNHFFSQIISYGLGEKIAVLAYIIFGIATMAGDLLCGILCSKISMKNSLSILYGLRAIIVIAFIFFAPKNAASIILFAIATGLTGDASVTPTSEIINQKYGAVRLAFLFGLVFVCHQIGAFTSTYLAGKLVALTQSYNTTWILDLILCAIAASISFKIQGKNESFSKKSFNERRKNPLSS